MSSIECQIRVSKTNDNLSERTCERSGPDSATISIVSLKGDDEGGTQVVPLSAEHK